MFESVRSGWSTHKKLMFLKAAAAVPAVEDSATGNPVTFLTDLAKPLKSLVANFLPIQASGTPSPENILPITGWAGVNVNHAGKNLFNMTGVSKTQNDVTWTVNGDTVTVSGVATGYSELVCGSVPLDGLEDVAVSGLMNTVNVVWNCNIKDKDDVILGSLSTTKNDIAFKVSDYPNAKSLNVVVKRNNNVETSGTFSVQVEAGMVATAYEPYIAPATYPASFPSTIYGGYVDLVTGEVWATHIVYNSTWATFGISRQSQGGIASKYYDSEYPIKCANVDPRPNIKMCNVAKWSWKDYDLSDPHYYSNKTVNAYRTYLYMPEETDGSLEIQLLMELVNPVLVTTLTPQQINAIKGNNTLWSNANGNLEVTYMKKG